MRREARAGVGDGDAQFLRVLVPGGEADGDFSLGPGVFDRVGDEVGEDLRQAGGIDVPFDRFALRDEGKAQSFGRPLRAQGLKGDAGPFVHFGALAGQAQLAVHHGGKIEQFVDHAREGAGIAVDDLDILELGRLERRIGAE